MDIILGAIIAILILLVCLGFGKAVAEVVRKILE